MSANLTNHFPALARPSSGEIPKVQPDAQGRASFSVLDLFSGIGGFALATEWAGGRTMAFAELAEYPSRILAARFPEIPNLGDVTKLCRRAYDCKTDPTDDEFCWCPRCDTDFGACECIGTDQFTDTHGWPDVIAGGVPCQPASLVGKRHGTADERWMWPDTLRIIGELRPRFAILENPAAILTLEDGRAFLGILGSFASLGYDVQWDVVSAAALGAGHRRERLWILAANSDSPRLEGHAGNGEAGGRAEARGHASAQNLRESGEQIRRWMSESTICRNLDGFSKRLDAALDIDTELGYWVSHAKTTFAYTEETVRLLQQGAYAEAIRVGIGESARFQSSKVLRPDLHGKKHGQGSQDAKRMATSGAEVSAEKLRALRNGARFGSPSQESGLVGQHAGKSPNALLNVSHEAPLEGGRYKGAEELFVQGLWRACGQVGNVSQTLSEVQKVWQSASDQDRDWIIVAAFNGGCNFHPRPQVKPVVNGLPSGLARDQLTAIGNSLVPQVAHVWMTAIAGYFEDIRTS